ncbi:hypothetical protein FRB94_005674 [Tulasnella sp. JGI-2019a]|nr:hypothetical protein FRB94_005674 [Tulasnella sp. JGI-2019a]
MFPSAKATLRWSVIGGYFGFVVLGLVIWMYGSSLHHFRAIPASSPDPGRLDVLKFVNGPPTNSVHDNLRNDTMYITSFIQAGFTNGLMTVANLIYLAILTSRVVILPPFDPSNIGPIENAGFVHFGDAFDINYFSEQTGVSLLEWRDVKKLPKDLTGPVEMDLVGCWTVHATANGRKGRPHGIRLHKYLGLDPSYTPVPQHMHMGDQHKYFHGLASLGYPGGYADGLVLGPQAHDDPSPFPSDAQGKTVPPDYHLMCMDTVYYVAGSTPFEWDKDYSPAWKFVGKYLRFTERVTNAAEVSLRKIWNLPEGEPIPKYVAVHARRGDFKSSCLGKPTTTCFAPLSVIAHHVDQIRNQLIERSRLSDPGSVVASANAYQRVLFTSDETDPAFWAEVRRRGWSKFGWSESGWLPESQSDSQQHKGVTEDEKAVQSYIPDQWWPTLVDAACQSMALGFVGTSGSTMSVLAIRRVEEWNGGIGVMVRYGPGMYPQGEHTIPN